ncbi:MAG: hypothetical protein ACOC1F_09665, partial [Myxococcota bacterium]
WMGASRCSRIEGKVFDYANEPSYAGVDGECSNCADTEESIWRVMRGGGYDTMWGTGHRVDTRTGFLPSSRNFSVGFRCAKDPAREG